MTGREHSKLLGIFFLVQGGLQIFGGLFVALIYGGMGAAFMTQSRRSEDQMMGGIFIVIAIVAVFFILIFAGLNFFAGWRLFKQQLNARTLGIVASCIALLSFPLGTALGIYGLWFFFGDEGKRFYSGNSGANFPPPPPQHWQ